MKIGLEPLRRGWTCSFMFFSAFFFSSRKRTQLMRSITSVPTIPKVLRNKPVVGETAFGYEAGIPVIFCKRLKAIDFLQGGLGYLPELIGNKFRIILEKKR